MTTPNATQAALAAQAAIATIGSSASGSFATMVTSLSSIGASLAGSTAENFGTFVTNFAQDVEANPLTPGVYSTAFNTRWAEFVAAEENAVDTDLAAAIGVVAAFFDSLASTAASAAKALGAFL